MEDVIEKRVLLSGTSYGEWANAWESREESAKYSPENYGVFSRMFMLWMVPVFRKGWSRKLDVNLLPGLRSAYLSRNLAPKFIESWERDAEQSNNKPSMFRVVLAIPSIRRTLVVGTICSLSQGVLSTVGRTVVLRILIQQVEAGADTKTSVGLVFLFAAVVLLEGWFGVLGRQMLAEEFASQFQIGANAAVMAKTLSLSHSDESTHDRVSEADLIGNDIVRAVENVRAASNLPMAISGLVGGVVVLGLYIGWPSVAGLCVMACILLFNIYTGNLVHSIEKQNVVAADKRLSILRNILDSIRAVKLFGWEEKYMERISHARAVECKSIRKYRVAQVSSIATGRASPVLSSVATLIAYSLAGNTLKIEDAYATVSVFQALRLGLIMIPLSVTSLMALSVTFKRLEQFLVLPDQTSPTYNSEDPDILVSMGNCDFGWSSEDKENNVSFRDLNGTGVAKVLSSVSLRVSRGTLIAVVGSVGSGKSTLLCGIIQCLPPLNVRRGDSKIATTRSIGYAPQKPFIICGTVKQNVLLGRPFDASKFEYCIRASALEHDLSLMPHGCDTEIGERGTSLSGGQQQRLALARAIYGSPELLVLDDPLSAVDSVVSNHIFENLILDHVRNQNKSCIMAMNQPGLLSKVDRILFLSGGKVQEDGSYAALMQDQEQPRTVPSFRDFVQNFIDVDHAVDGKNEFQEADIGSSDNGAEAETQKLLSPPKLALELEIPNSILKTEHRIEGAVSTSVYFTYVQAMRPLLFFSAIIVCLASYILMSANDYWLTLWANADEDRLESNDDGSVRSRGFYAGIYALMSVVYGSGILGASLIMSYAGVRASLSLHHNLMRLLLGTPLYWFESTSSGRILSRFSSDFVKVDLFLSLYVDHFIQMTCILLVLLGIIIVAVPIMSTIIAASAVIYGALIKGLDRTSREVRRMTNNAQSPLLSNVHEAVAGRDLAKAMELCEFFKARHRLASDEFIKINFVAGTIINWSYLVSHFLSFIVSVSSAAMLILLPNMVNQEIIGLSLTYAFLVPYFACMVTENLLRSNLFFTSLERLLEYENLPQESSRTTDEDPPKGTWPVHGGIAFETVQLQYRPDLPIVLKNVSCTITGGSSVGVVGRSGAGKSSLIAALFRLVEVSSGRILIDGVDISRIGLQVLRSNLTIIPQDPILMRGTIKDNLDPFHEYEDHELEKALALAHLRDRFKINQQVLASGKNFSQGERQLICFARAVLKQNKILIMDEPTSSIDSQTDEMIQTMVKTEFMQRRHCTVLCIAHRLQTIIDYEKVLVMENGKIIEFDTPFRLLENRNSRFSAMVRATGPGLQARICAKARLEPT